MTPGALKQHREQHFVRVWLASADKAGIIADPDCESAVFLERLPEFISNHFILTSLFLLVLFLIISHEVQHFSRKYKSIQPAELTRLVNRENALLVDVSTQGEFEAGHIAGSRHVAMTQFDPDNKDLAKVRELPVILVCKSGQNSAKACERLTKAGFGKVYWLDGGLSTWASADLPLMKGKA